MVNLRYAWINISIWDTIAWTLVSAPFTLFHISFLTIASENLHGSGHSPHERPLGLCLRTNSPSLQIPPEWSGHAGPSPRSNLPDQLKYDSWETIRKVKLSQFLHSTAPHNWPVSLQWHRMYCFAGDSQGHDAFEHPPHTSWTPDVIIKATTLMHRAVKRENS